MKFLKTEDWKCGTSFSPSFEFSYFLPISSYSSNHHQGFVIKVIFCFLELLSQSFSGCSWSKKGFRMAPDTFQFLLGHFLFISLFYKCFNPVEIYSLSSRSLKCFCSRHPFHSISTCICLQTLQSFDIELGQVLQTFNTEVRNVFSCFSIHLFRK